VCGSADVAWIGWGGSVEHQLRLAKIHETRLIAGGQFEPKSLCPSACLSCQPEWRQVHELAIEEEQYQLHIEDRIAAADFDGAVPWRDKKRVIHERIRALLNRLGIEIKKG
jgi:hypothetical protein